jgi:drug/metabolite transporter (DMT)-like permease
MAGEHRSNPRTSVMTSPKPETTIEGTMVAPAPTAGTSLYVKLVMVALFWGGTFIAGKTVAESLPLLTAAWGRFLVAAVLLILVAVKAEGGLPRLTRSQALVTAGLGLTGIFLYNFFFLGALARIPAGRTALLVTLNPIVTAVAAGVLFRERLGWKKWLGIVIALCGASIILTRGDLVATVHDIGTSIGFGELSMLLAVLSWAAYTLIGRTALESLSPIAATTYAALWGLGFLSIGAAGEIGSVSWTTLGWQVWASILYLGAFGTVFAFIWYYQGVRAIGPSRTAVFNNLVPAFGVIMSAVLLGEQILASMIIGGLLTALGVSLTNRT